MVFKDYNNVTRTIYIQQDGWSGGITNLTPGNNPIIWEEDDSDNLLSYVRGKTGKMEVVEENYGDLNDLIPATNLQNRVVCPGQFFGYMKAQSSSNIWDSKRVLKFNILSPLAMTNNLYMPIGDSNLRTMSSVLSDMLTLVGYTAIIMPITEIMGATISGLFITPFADDKDYHYANNDEVYNPISIGTLLEALCERYGMTAHEVVEDSNPILILSSVVSNVENGSIKYYRYTLRNGSFTRQNIIVPANAEALFNSDRYVADNNNTEQIVQPYSDINIRLVGSAFTDCDLPTERSEQDNQPYGRFLTPRGNWITVASGFSSDRVQIEGKVISNDIKDTIAVNENSINEGTEMFTLQFVEFEENSVYHLKLKKTGTATSMRIKVYSDGKWLNFDTGAFTNFETYKDFDFSTLTDNEADIRMVSPSQYIQVVCIHCGSAGSSNIYDVKIERETGESSPWVKYFDQNFVKKITNGQGSNTLELPRTLNDKYKSNYYEDNYSPPDPNYLLYSQLRLKIKVRTNDEPSYLLYLKQFSIDSSNRKWRIISVSQNLRDSIHTITLHYSEYF